MAQQLPKMLTASLLRDGEAVWWSKNGWVDQLADGELLADVAAEKAALDAADADVSANLVVNPYLFEVRVRDGRIRPVKEKEIIRAGGPSIHADLGKQARHVSLR